MPGRALIDLTKFEHVTCVANENRAAPSTSPANPASYVESKEPIATIKKTPLKIPSFLKQRGDNPPRGLMRGTRESEGPN
jgi:hypothetical protein